MATYKGIQGYSVQKLATDPTVADTVGQLWYNSTSGKFKISTEGAGAWAAGASFNADRSGRGSAGPNSATLMFGGFNPTSSVHGNTEKYDGTTWTELNNLNTPRAYGASAQQGTQTAALMGSGTTSAVDGKWCESWDGTCWAEVGDTNVTHAYTAGNGTSTAALAIGTGPPPQALVESWDGTSWTQVGTLTTGRYFLMAAGTQAAGLAFGGEPFRDVNEEFDGTSWTEVNDLNVGRNAGGGAGTQTAALMITGLTGPTTFVATTEKWDGTSWTEVADLATGRSRVGTSGTTGAAIVGGGQTGPSTIVGTVEVWSDPVYAAKTVTVS